MNKTNIATKLVSAVTALAVLSMTSSLPFFAADALAKPKNNTISVVPTITSVTVVGGQLVAAGTATATIKGQTYTVPFSGVPVDIKLAANQQGAGACPILDLMLGPIHLNLLGLDVQTSPICLTITAFDQGGLLGDLLCSIANLLNGGLTLSQILAGQGTGTLPGLTAAQLTSLLGGLANLLNAALANLYQAILTLITQGTQQHQCAILHLELGPLDLTLLGLQVVLDNCMNGPVTVDITGITGQGNLLGNLLCQLLGGGLINIGTTLQNILNQILSLLNQ
jgi:hypothetical protein